MFSIAAQLIEARTEANRTQKQVARRMGPTKSVVGRLESGHPLPSVRSLKRYGWSGLWEGLWGRTWPSV